MKIELYDLQQDLGETTDVAAQHPKLVAQLRRIMHQARIPSPFFPMPALDAPNDQ